MKRETSVASIPDIRDDNVTEVLRAIKNVLQVREGHIGDPLDQSVTLRDLTDLQLVNDASGGGVGTPTTGGGVIPVRNPALDDDGYNPSQDFLPPPSPSGLTAIGGFANVYLSWDGAPYRNHAFTEIWRASTDNIGDAVLVGRSNTNLYTDPADEGETYYYWIRFVSLADVAGAYNATLGTMAQTAVSPGRLLELLTGQITESQLYSSLGARIDLVDGPLSLAGSVAARIYSEEVARIAADTSLGSSITTLETTTSTHATQLTSLTTRTTAAESSIISLQNTTASQATSISSLTTRVGSAESNITNLQTTTSNQATSITNLSTTVSGHTTTLQTQATSIGGLQAQYTVKIDNNGYVTGFGLASTAVNGTPTSSFIVRADSFSIASPSGPGVVSPTTPFIVRTTSTTINGETVGPGVYISDAFIQNGTITSAKIGSLVANKITTGTLTATLAVNAGKIYGGVNPSGSAPGSAGFGTGYLIGDYSGATQLFVGSPTQYLHWNGTSLTVKAIIYASAGFIGQNIIDATGISSPNYVSGSTGWSVNYTGAAEFNQATIRGDVIVGSNPAISGTTMTGTGSRLYSNGRMIVGNSTNNMVWDGSNLYINGFVRASTSSWNSIALFGYPTGWASSLSDGPFTLMTFTKYRYGYITVHGTINALSNDGVNGYGYLWAGFGVQLLNSSNSAVAYTTVHAFMPNGWFTTHHYQLQIAIPAGTYTLVIYNINTNPDVYKLNTGLGYIGPASTVTDWIMSSHYVNLYEAVLN